MVEEKIRHGYKKTEIGTIPDDWYCFKMGDIGETVIGLTYKPENIKQFGTLVLRSSNIAENKLKFIDNVFVDINVKERLIVKKDDLLICVRNGSRNLIGKCALIDKKAVGSTFGAFMSIYRSNKSKYIFQYFQSDIVKKQINENMGATINQITNKDLNSFLVTIPSNKKEEDEIVKALSDVDNLIESLEKLIDKKKKVKQGTMQQLLTGKRRLPEFEGKWNKVTLNNIGLINIDSINPQNYSDCLFEVFSMPSYDDGKKPEYIYGREILSNKLKIKQNVLLFNKLNIRQKRVWHVSKCSNNAICSSEFLPYYSDIVNLEYLSYLFSSERFINNFINLSSGTSNSQQRINPKDFLKTEVLLPELKEQNAIAKVLLSIDSEIEVLEQKLKKYKKIKQGMMHELLTGRIRLI